MNTQASHVQWIADFRASLDRSASMSVMPLPESFPSDDEILGFFAAVRSQFIKKSESSMSLAGIVAEQAASPHNTRAQFLASPDIAPAVSSAVMDLYEENRGTRARIQISATMTGKSFAILRNELFERFELYEALAARANSRNDRVGAAHQRML